METPIKIVLLGIGAVGKSSITVQEVSGHFMCIYDPTIEESYKTSLTVDGEVVSLDLQDTSGQEEYSALRDNYIRGGDGYVIVYSITSQASFLEAQNIIEDVYRILDIELSEHIPILLAGNKSDLEEERAVKKEDAQSVANRWNLLCLDCSAKTKYNVENLFIEISRDVLQKRKEMHEKQLSQQKKKNKFKKCTIV
ncbi:hypothetical protein EIN_094180 [Entamoeba invadens IP1]|uniref:Uncharacterized protein n=1 Tax=Entamoeba invadens IP1 TaxID=370355 RepID=A0A0A1U5X4_ENTIV|nr:hypothetical protein EIN_094180 [Entamoeba invadens IP1]ELP87231.1 hypothetical protein EIN_094180 [Entamoeba invadens IP1]|eukprot:XP_004254002.1 hypothetical protein EIN_094180 [Entamoeba invadens IP1]